MLYVVLLCFIMFYDVLACTDAPPEMQALPDHNA